MVNQFQIAVNPYVLTRTHRHLIPFYLFARPLDARFSADLKQLCDSLTLPPVTFLGGGGIKTTICTYKFGNNLTRKPIF